MPAAPCSPPPWTIDEASNACFIVRDSTGQALAYVYFEDEPGRRSDVRFGNCGHRLRSKRDGSVVNDPYRSSAAKFCCDAQRSSHTEFLVGSD